MANPILPFGADILNYRMSGCRFAIPCDFATCISPMKESTLSGPNSEDGCVLLSTPKEMPANIN